MRRERATQSQSIRRMKKTTMTAMLLIGSVIGAVLGARYHPQILSLRDGCSRIDLDSDPAPDGFEISPDQASFIFSSLLNNAWHWGANGATSAYVDGDSYYILGLLPQGQTVCSYTARLLGTRIHGKDGRIFNRISGQWEKKGYVHRFRADIQNTVTNGMSDVKLRDLIGTPFSTRERAGADNSGAPVDLLHYWSRDGEVLIFLKEGSVTGVSTNIPFLRL